MSKRVLLAEGDDDVHVVEQLCKSHGIALPIATNAEYRHVASNGLTDLLMRIRNLVLNEASLTHLAIVVDADDDPAKVWEKLTREMTALGNLTMPKTYDPAGVIVERDDGFKVIRIGIWLMPDNQNAGELETFLSPMMPASDARLACVDAFLASIPVPFRTYKHVKARVRAFLAVQKEPGFPPGRAIGRKYLDAVVPDVNPFLAWVRKALNV